MGNTQSQVPKEGQGHPEQFYRGVAAAKCARFTVSEVYFVQALQRHPGRAFWEQLMQGVNRAASSEQGATADRCEEGDEQDNDAHDSAWAELQTVRGQRHRQRTYTDADDHVTNVAELRGCKSVCSTLAGRRCHAAVSANGSTTKSTAASAKRSTATAAHLYNVKAVDVHLPLNGELLPILDYYRLMADIALTYVELLRTTRHPEKVSGFAARYCLFGITHTQALLHCLTLWKEETFGDGLGILDYEGRRRHNPLGGFSNGSVFSGTAGEKMLSGRNGATGPTSRTDVRNFTLALAEAHCRYFYLSLLAAYNFLLFRAMVASADRGRKQMIYSNLLDHLDAVFRVTWEVADEYPRDYVGKLIMQNAPLPATMDFTHEAWHANRSAASFLQTVGQRVDVHHHQTSSAAAEWTPYYSGLFPLSFARHVRLCVQTDGAGLPRPEARLLSPALRMSYHYINWGLEGVLLVVPGCNPYMLKNALPGFVPGKGTFAHQTEFTVNPKAPLRLADTTAPARELRGSAADTRAATSAAGSLKGVRVASKGRVWEWADLLAKCRGKMKTSARNINTDLDLSDARTLAVLCLDEAMILTLADMLLLVRVRAMAGDTVATSLRAAALERIVDGLHGPESPEKRILQQILQPDATD